MNSEGKLVFVTTELYPFTGGGIGRFTYNLLKSLPGSEMRRTIVLLTNGTISESQFSLVFPGVSIACIANQTYSSEPNYFPNPGRDEWFDVSVRILLALRNIASKHKIDYIEFPDWSGLGFATLQERLAHSFLRDTQMAVRIHSTEAILVLRESRLLRHSDLRRYDLERKCYRDCDTIIAHLTAVAEETRKAFGFTSEEWWPRVHVTPAPVDIGSNREAERTIEPTNTTPILFTSKFQEFKRPEVFIQGAVEFLQTNESYKGKVILACGALNNEYAAKILETIPRNLKNRFVKAGDLSASKRDALISEGIVAFPSSFESFCLAAYEASLLGAVVLLNRSNPAFGEGTPWIESENCVKFDGSARDLALCLAKAVSLKKSLSVVSLPSLDQPWRREPAHSEATRVELPADKLVSVIVDNQGEGVILADTLDSILDQDYPHFEVIVVDDGSRDSASQTIFRQLERDHSPRLHVLRSTTPMGHAESLNAALNVAQGEYVVTASPGDVLLSGYITSVVAALDRNPQYAVAVSQLGYYTDLDRTNASELETDTFAGEAFVSGSQFNYFSNGPRAFRKSVVDQVQFRPKLGALTGWGWMFDVVMAGYRVITSPQILAFSRHRDRVDIADPIDEFSRLHHLMIANAPTQRTFPVASLALVAEPIRVETINAAMPSWYNHAVVNGYEPELEFVANTLGHTWLGKAIRENSAVSSAFEKIIRWVSGPMK